jgi:Asp-tRNA(Asn)/Glu-tRNA(Gln) amidotransferase A subunit family amidase
MRSAARALEGIPTSVKDEDAIAGWPVTASSQRENDGLPNRDVTGTRREPALDRGFLRMAAFPDEAAGQAARSGK